MLNTYLTMKSGISLEFNNLMTNKPAADSHQFRRTWLRLNYQPPRQATLDVFS